MPPLENVEGIYLLIWWQLIWYLARRANLPRSAWSRKIGSARRVLISWQGVCVSIFIHPRRRQELFTKGIFIPLAEISTASGGYRQAENMNITKF